MNRKQQLQSGSLKLPHAGRIGVHDHVTAAPDHAGRRGTVNGFDVNKTQPAGSRGMIHSPDVAKIRDVDTVIQTDFQQIRAFCGIDCFVVDVQRDRHRIRRCMSLFLNISHQGMKTIVTEVS
jgi:hypothetical protein